MVPFNGSIFELRDLYEDCFPKYVVDPAEFDGNVYKIQYIVNMLPNINTPEGMESITSLLENKTDEDEMQIFSAEPLVQVIDYKWDTYGYKVHSIGVCMHLLYLTTITVYNLLTY